MLIDRIVKPGAIINNDELDMPLVMKWLKTSYVLRATNVSDTIRSMHDGEFNALTDLPNIAPPFENMFIEWSESHLSDNDKDEVFHVAMLINSCDREKEPDAACWSREFRGLDVRWSCNAFLFQFFINKKVAAYQGHIFWGVSPSGELTNHRKVVETFPEIVCGDELQVGIACSPSQFVVDSWKRMGHSQDDAGEKAASENFSMTQVPLTSICFLHAKNVTVQKSPAPTTHQIKAFRKMDKPLFRYHTITIDPRHARVTGGQDGTPRGGHNAVHICRGHFKKFTPEKPLLGKHVGVYWWPMMLRGSKSEGVVVKDYKIDGQGS